MPDAKTNAAVVQYRQQMERRLARAQRRHAQIRQLDRDKGNAQVIEDDVAHLLAELKNIRHDFGACCKACNYPRLGNKKMEAWSQTLPPDQSKVWGDVANARDCDVHTRPIETRETSLKYLWQAGGQIYGVQTAGYLVSAAGIGSFELLTFCENAVAVYTRFISEFHTLL